MILHNKEKVSSANLHTDGRSFPLIDSEPEAAFQFFQMFMWSFFFFSFLHWQIYEQAIHHQKHCRDRNPRRKEGRGGVGGLIILDLLKSDFDKCKIFQNMFSLQIQLSKVLLQSFGVFFHSFGVYIEFSTFFISSNIQLSFPPILSTRHFYRWSSSCIFAMKRLKSRV